MTARTQELKELLIVWLRSGGENTPTLDFFVHSFIAMIEQYEKGDK